MATPTTDQLRDRIDSGATGEKVGMPDPATVPLGTDVEAGGNPPTVRERKLAAVTAPEAPRTEWRPSGIVVYGAAIVVIAVLVIAIVLAATAS